MMTMLFLTKNVLVVSNEFVKNIDAVECLGFLKKLQEKFAYVSGWTPFYFNCFSAGNNIVVYQFISKNKNEIRVFGYFCSLAIF